jgi:hypothetical protein
MRIYVYVDGFNLYYRALKGGPHKWLNLVALAGRLAPPGATIDLVRYFTARVSARAGDPDAPRRQQILFSALLTLPNIRFHYGSFLAKTVWRPLVSNPKKFVEIHDTEEKGSDVNLAAHLINDAWHGRYDVALVLSQDSDLIEPIKMARSDVGKSVGLIWLDGGKPSKYLADAASYVKHLSKSDLVAAQFPNPVIRQDCHEIHKPSGW